MHFQTGYINTEQKFNCQNECTKNLHYIIHNNRIYHIYRNIHCSYNYETSTYIYILHINLVLYNTTKTTAIFKMQYSLSITLKNHIH